METASLNTIRWNPLAVVGLSGSGKSHLLREWCSLQTNSVIADERVLPKRGRVGDLATQYRKQVMPQKADEVFGLLDLATLKNTRFHELTPGQASAACLFPVLAIEAPLLAIDMLLDWVDWRVSERVWEHLLQRAEKSSKIVVATHSPYWLSRCEGFAVVKDHALHLTGDISETLSGMEPTEFKIESVHGDAIRELVKPFRVDIHHVGNEYSFSAPPQDGMMLELLLKGYGKLSVVKAIYPDERKLMAHLLSRT